MLKKELLAAGIAALVSLPGKGEAKTASAPEARIEAYALPEESMEPAAEFPLDGVSDADYNDGNFEYDRRLSRGLSVKYTGAYVDYETRDVIYKAADPHDKDYRSTIDACLESQNSVSEFMTAVRTEIIFITKWLLVHRIRSIMSITGNYRAD